MLFQHTPARLVATGAAVLVVLLLCACTVTDRYGSEARYAPSYRSYVLSPENGTDDPERDDAVLILRSPIDETKIRCREDLERWMPHYRTHALDTTHDDNWMLASVLLMAPASAVAGLGVDVAVIGIGVAEIPYMIARSEEGGSIYERGVEAFEREDWSDASRLLELALVKDQRGLSTYYLGISYANSGYWDEARSSLTAFVERSLVQEVTAYRNAERWLRYLDQPIEGCRSQEPIKIRW